VTTLLSLAVSILPVFLLLVALVLIDSYKLVALRAVLLSVGAGVGAALLSWAVNRWLAPELALAPGRYSMYVAPLVEESLKGACILYLLFRNRLGFVVDAAILGFGIGTGFAFLENLWYLRVMPDATIWTWIVRGFGTAIMHGGATAILAMIAKTFYDRAALPRPWVLLPGLAGAILLHSLYNHFLLHPLLATGIIVLVFPWTCIVVFHQSEQGTREWLGAGFDIDQELLRAMRAGKLAATPVGEYLTTLRDRFDPEVIVDMMGLLRLRAELALKAKGILMMREAGFEAEPDPSLKATFDELRYLERSIGRTGMLALTPFLHTSTRDLWELTMLDRA